MSRDTSTKTIPKDVAGSGWPKPPGSNGSNGNGKKDWFRGRRPFPKGTYRIAIWMVLAAVTMTFVALASAYIFLSGSDQWRPVIVPKAFFLSTSIILVSSLTMERSRRLVQIDAQRYGRWLLLTLGLGIAFVVTQFIGWRHLATQGVYVSSNPHSSFFYLFTGAHGLHLAGGMVALTYLVVRSRYLLLGVESEKRVAATDAVSVYWHFMDGLWVALFLLLWFWN